MWHGRQKEVLVSKVEGEPLVGSLLHGSRLTVDVVEGGSATIEELQRPA